MDQSIILRCGTTATTITRAIVVDGEVRLQYFTNPVELVLDRGDAEDLLALAEGVEEAQSTAERDAYLAKLVQAQCHLSDGQPMLRRGDVYYLYGETPAPTEEQP